MIYSYILTQIGDKVCQIDEKTGKDTIKRLLETLYDIESLYEKDEDNAI
jgi:hypothetical protein